MKGYNFMKILILIITILIFFNCIRYSIYEININKNKSAGITVSIIGLFQLIFTNIALFKLNI